MCACIVLSKCLKQFNCLPENWRNAINKHFSLRVLVCFQDIDLNNKVEIYDYDHILKDFDIASPRLNPLFHQP